MQEGGFVDETPESVAKFLFRQERLSKKQIGKKPLTGKHLHFLPFLFYRKIFGKSWRFQQTSLETLCPMSSIFPSTFSPSVTAVFVEF